MTSVRFAATGPASVALTDLGGTQASILRPKRPSDQHDDRTQQEEDQLERMELADDDDLHDAHPALDAMLCAANHTATETKPTTVTELSGMRIAAINGVKCPLTAKDTPVTL